MLYGNNGNGYGYSPNRANEEVNRFNYSSNFNGVSGSRQGGYYYSATPRYTTSKSNGYYDGRGVYHAN